MDVLDRAPESGQTSLTLGLVERDVGFVDAHDVCPPSLEKFAEIPFSHCDPFFSGFTADSGLSRLPSTLAKVAKKAMGDCGKENTPRKGRFFGGSFQSCQTIYILTKLISTSSSRIRGPVGS